MPFSGTSHPRQGDHLLTPSGKPSGRRTPAPAFGLIAAVFLVTSAPFAVGQEDYLRLFPEKHYQGPQTVLTPLQNMPDLEKSDNRASSLIYKLPPGRVCMLFIDKNYEGASLVLQGTGYKVEIPDLHLYSRNISSLRWDTTGGQITNPDGAFGYLYSGPSFSSRRLVVTFGLNVPDLRGIADEEGRNGFDNAVQSARWLIPPGWNLVLYKNRDYEGDAVELRGSGAMDSTSTLDKFAGKASSLRWEPTRPGGAVGTFTIPQVPR